MDKIICFGKNYSDHMLELGDAPVDKPVIFLKPPSVLKQCEKWNETIQASVTENETHYECELVLKLSKGGYQMTYQEASAAISEYTIGLDMTLRTIQASLKKNGHPWTTGKVFPDACIMGPWIKYTSEDFLNTPFSFCLDGEIKQQSVGKAMLFKPEELIVYASQFFPLCAGDVLFTGTPAGVGPIHKKSIGILTVSDFKYTVHWQSYRC